MWGFGEGARARVVAAAFRLLLSLAGLGVRAENDFSQVSAPGPRPALPSGPSPRAPAPPGSLGLAASSAPGTPPGPLSPPRAEPGSRWLLAPPRRCSRW